MNWKRTLGAVAAAGATAGATVISPALGAVVGGALAAGAGTKAAGQALEARGLPALHKPLGPLAAVGGAVAVGQVVDAEALCAAVQAACSQPEALVALLGVLIVGVHQLWAGATKASVVRPGR